MPKAIETIAAIRDSGLPPTWRLVLIAYALRANEDGHAWPGPACLARDTGLSSSTVRRVRRELREHRLIVKVRRTSENRLTDTWRISVERLQKGVTVNRVHSRPGSEKTRSTVDRTPVQGEPQSLHEPSIDPSSEEEGISPSHSGASPEPEAAGAVADTSREGPSASGGAARRGKAVTTLYEHWRTYHEKADAEASASRRKAGHTFLKARIKAHRSAEDPLAAAYTEGRMLIDWYHLAPDASWWRENTLPDFGEMLNRKRDERLDRAREWDAKPTASTTTATGGSSSTADDDDEWGTPDEMRAELGGLEFYTAEQIDEMVAEKFPVGLVEVGK